MRGPRILCFHSLWSNELKFVIVLMIPSLGLVNRVYRLVKWASLPWNEEETKPSMSCKTSSTCRVAQLNAKLSLKIELPLMQVKEISKTLSWSTSRMIQNTWRDNPSSLIVLLNREVVKKNGYCTVRPFGPDRKQMWKFWSIFSLKFDSLILKTHFILSKMHFSYPFCGCQNHGRPLASSRWNWGF